MIEPVLFLSAAPKKLIPRSIDLSAKEVEQLILHPPDNRRSGWNMDFPRPTIQRGANSLTRGDRDLGALTLLSSGYMELVVAGASPFCWPQEEEEIKKAPRLSPYAVCEFPVTFLRLYRLIVDRAKLSAPFIVTMAYKSIKGVALWPGHPSSIAYGSPFLKFATFFSDDLILDPLSAEQSFVPDKIALQLLSEVYRAFGYGQESIPFYNEHSGQFSF